MYKDKNIFESWGERADHGVKVDKNFTCYAFLLTPFTKEDQGDLAPKYGSVLVSARSAADARVVASQAETCARSGEVAIGDKDLTTNSHSAFRNEKLYGVFQLSAEPIDAPRGVIALERGGFNT